MSDTTPKNEATDPLKNEANGQSGTFTFRGHTFTVPLDREEWSLDFLEAIEDGKAAGTVRGALGDRQWRIVKSLDLKVKELVELSDLVADTLGFGSTGE